MMRACHCTLPYLDPKACERCSYQIRDGFFFIPVDPKYFDFEIGDDRYIITRKKEK